MSCFLFGACVRELFFVWGVRENLFGECVNELFFVWGVRARVVFCLGSA